MRPPRPRQPVQFALAALLAAAIIPLLPSPVDAAGGATLTVRVGYQGEFKTGEWMPVTIDARNAGSPIDGTLQVQETLNAQPGVTGLTVYQEPLSLASGASKRLRIYIEYDNSAAGVTVRLIQSGRVLASQQANASGNTNYLIGVLSDQPATLDDFAAIHPASVNARVVHLTTEELPDTAVALRAFDILAMDDFASDGLTAAQRAAMVDFVSAGGDLLLGSGAAWHKTLGGLPASLLPMQVSGTAVVDSNAPGSSATEIATGTLTNGNVWLAQNSLPLLIERPVGAGTVTLATFDWNAAPAAVSDSSNGVLRQVMSRALFGSGGSAQNFASAGGFGGPALIGPYNAGSSPSLVSKSSALTPVMANLPGLDLPSLQLTAALVLLYVLVVGPINYLVLGAVRRRALAWVTIPAIALLATGGAYGTAVITKGRSVQINQVAIVHIQPGTDRAYEENYTGVIPPSRGDYVASMSGDHILISPIANNYTGPGFTASGLKVDVASNAVTLSGMTAFSLGGFASEGMTSAPQLTGHLQLVGGTLVGTVENHSNLTFSDGVVIAGDNFQTFGELRPGASARISVVPKATNPFGQPSYTRIYGGNQYIGPYNGSTTSDREATMKTQILSLLPTGSTFKGATAYASPLLVGWTHQAFQSVTVNNNQPRTTTMSAVAVSLAVDQIATGPLPTGVVNSRIVDVVGDSQGNGPPGMLVLQNGSVTFEFAPNLAAGKHLSGVSMTSNNPYSAKLNGAPGTTNAPGVSGQVWDWTTQSWDDINYQDNGTTALPDSAVNPQTGLVRVRISSTNGGFLAGSLTLSGTVA